MISRPVTASCSPEMMGFRIYKGIPPKMRKPFRFRNYSNLPSWIEVMFISAKVFLVGARNVPKFKRSISWDMRSFRLPVSQEWLSMLVFIWRQHLQSNMWQPWCIKMVRHFIFGSGPNMGNRNDKRKTCRLKGGQKTKILIQYLHPQSHHLHLVFKPKISLKVHGPKKKKSCLQSLIFQKSSIKNPPTTAMIRHRPRTFCWLGRNKRCTASALNSPP